MDAYIGERAANGVFLDGGGLYGTEDAVNFVVRKGEVTRVDGPYAEAKEVVGGWSILQYDTVEDGGGRPAGVRRAAREVLARGHRGGDPAPDLHGPGGARRLNGLTTLASCRQGPARDDPNEAVFAAWRAESARLVGALTRMTRDVDSPRTLPRTRSWPRSSSGPPPASRRTRPRG